LCDKEGVHKGTPTVPNAAYFLLDLARVLLATAAIGLFSPEPDYDEPAAPAWPDLTQIALIILAACLFVANVGGIWWLVSTVSER
jgi:hypothetical protein